MDWPKDLKHTRQREKVWNLLEQVNRPLRAIDIFEEVRVDECIIISTVYRILDAFEEHGMVEKIRFPEDDTAFYKIRTDEHRHYATCLLCHRQIPLDGCPVERLELKQDLKEFTITGHRLEIYGYCADCRKKLNRG